MDSGTFPADNRLSSSTFIEFCVGENGDTVQISGRDGTVLTTWTDTTDAIHFNYILAQKYNDPSGNDAVIEFCDGGMLFKIIILTNVV